MPTGLLRRGLYGVLIVAASGCSRDPAAASRRHLGRGDSYLAAGQFPEAAIEYRNAIRYAPASVEAHSKLAEAARRADDLRTTLLQYLRVAELDPGNVEAQIRAASVQLLAGRYDDARQRAEAAVRAAPDQPAAHLVLGHALGALHDRERSLVSLSEAVRLAPGRPELHVALGSAYWSAGRTEEAEAELRKAVEVAPADPAANRALALLFMATQRVADAESHWTTVARAPAGDPFALADYLVLASRWPEALEELDTLARAEGTRDGAALRLASARFVRGDREGAHASLEALLDRDPRHVEGLLLRARLFAAEGRLGAALAAAESAVAVDPASTRALLLQGQILAASGANERALEATRHAERLEPENPAVVAAVVGALVRAGQTVRAELEARRAAERWPEEPAFQTLVAMMMEAQGLSAAAQGEYERALARFPTGAVAANNLAWLYANADRLEEALQWAAVAERGLPDHAAVQHTFGWIHLRGGEPSKAVARFTRAVALQPGNPRYRYHLALAYSRLGSPEDVRRELSRVLESPHPFAEREAAARLLATVQDK
jgi:tetratricopeptide (TPR) repeat protein